MLSPSSTAILAMLIPSTVALLSYIIARLLKTGVSIAKAVCILASYLSLLLISTLIPVVRYDIIRVSLIPIHLPIGVINIGLYIDCLSLIPALISSLFTALALTYNIHYLSPYNRAYKVGWEFNRSYPFILIFNSAMLAMLFSDNLLTLLIFWELISLCSYILISFWSESDLSISAAMKALIMTHIGGLTLLVASIIIHSVTGTLEIQVVGQRIAVNDPITHIILLLLIITALPKMVLFPLHTWLPDATIAPTSTILVFHEGGSLAGIYIIIRFFSNILHTHTSSTITSLIHPIFGSINLWGFITSLIGSLTLVIGVLNALIESDLKRIVAYTTISGLGYIAIAVGLATPLGIVAALFLMISHAFTSGLLFLCAGAVVYATGRYNINDIEGLYQLMPITTLYCLIGVLSMSTIPLFSDFAGKYLVFNAIIEAKASFFIIIAFLGCILNAAAAVRMFYSVFIRRTAKPPLRLTIRNPTILMILPMTILSTAIMVFGIAPAALLDLLVIPAVKQLLGDLSINMTLQQGVIETTLGFWNPTTTSISIAILLALSISIILYSRKAALAHRAAISEEAVKPFICGEDSGILDNPQAHHFYHVLAEVLRTGSLRSILDIDRAYYSLSTIFFKLTERMRCFDIRQNYFYAILSFTLGALIITVLAVLVG
ncbi:MAG: proton-conducting transporter membrane subunit [Candidatus Bathyarchaeia archaeon]|nr:hypothetical protein [Candidatus Bathyarchaeota archaeon]